jgi:hypothetical protein
LFVVGNEWGYVGGNVEARAAGYIEHVFKLGEY